LFFEAAGHELTARVNLLPVAAPEASVTARIEKLERKRANDEKHLFEEVCAISAPPVEDAVIVWPLVPAGGGGNDRAD